MKVGLPLPMTLLVAIILILNGAEQLSCHRSPRPAYPEGPRRDCRSSEGGRCRYGPRNGCREEGKTRHAMPETCVPYARYHAGATQQSAMDHCLRVDKASILDAIMKNTQGNLIPCSSRSMQTRSCCCTADLRKRQANCGSRLR